jgi:hypothetical protein
MRCESEKQIPHPAKTAEIRDDTPLQGPLWIRMSTKPLVAGAP